MNKSELIEYIVEEVSLSKADAERAMNAMIKGITQSLKNGVPVVISGIGTLKVTDTKARMGRNPRTGEAIQIPAGKRVGFSAGKALKDAVSS